MPMYNLIEYSSSSSEITGRLWFYSKDEAADFNADIANTNNSNLLSIRLNYKETQETQLLNMLQIKLMEFWKILQLLPH